VRQPEIQTNRAFFQHLSHTSAAAEEILMSLTSYKGKTPQLAEGVYVHPSSVLVGDIQIGLNSSIWPLVAARGDVNIIRIGERTNVQDGSVLHVSRPTSKNPAGSPLVIGDDVTVGHKVMLHGCQLGNRILVGMGAIVMDDVIVEDDVIIGAGSLVPPGKRLESGYLYVGSPVKQARPLNEAERSFLTQSAINYVVLKDEYLAEPLS
jgi:carbonic anhydrase/acetyltransferase-like protein (isoleucine patch superfamily)